MVLKTRVTMTTQSENTDLNQTPGPESEGENDDVQIDQNDQNDPNDQSDQMPDAELDEMQSEQDREDALSAEKFREGDRLTFVRVRFPGNAKSFPFFVGQRRFQYGQKVVAMSDRGMTVGYINSFPYELPFHKNMLPIRSISKLATEEDFLLQRENLQREREASKLCARLIDDFKLEMNITHVEFTQFGKKAVFYFNAPQRVDFRDLVKKLVTELKMRVELRQISVRDRSAAIGGIGVCGLQTCCSSFLRNYGNVSIKMAKNQNLALIPSKINGVCGQLKCCLRYEDEVYLDKRRRLPREGSFVALENGDKGKVLRIHVLIEQFELLTDQGQKRRYSVSLYDTSSSLPEGWKFPTEFQHIIDESKEVLGLSKEEQKQAEEFVGFSEAEHQEIALANLADLDDQNETGTAKSDDSDDNNSKPQRSENNENDGAPRKRRPRKRRRGPKKPVQE